jgi:hypothetical protein
MPYDANKVKWAQMKVGVVMSIPFFVLAVLALRELHNGGAFWLISRQHIRLCCWGIAAGGLAFVTLALPRTLSDWPDSVRLRAWANFLIGFGYVLTGGVLQWYLLAMRDYEHPSLEPFKVMWLLAVAWVILIVFSICAMLLERASGNKGSESKAWPRYSPHKEAER